MRLFVAFDLPPAELGRLAESIAKMRRSSPAAGWVRPTQMHVTLRFLGAVEESQVAPLTEALSTAARAAGAPFEVALDGPGAFPSLARPRVLWFGIDPPEPVKRLSEAIDDALAPLDLPREERENIPHLTIARIRHPWRAADGEKWAAAVRASAPGRPFRVDRFRLVRSRLLPEGATHESAAEFLLG